MNTELESYLPLFYAIPEEWEDAKPFFSEVLKKISDITNTREIGWLLNEELLNGQQFISSTPNTQNYRSVFRKVVDCGQIVAGVPKIVPHGVNYTNFTLIHLYGAGTNAVKAAPIPNDGFSSVYMTTTDVVINSAESYDSCFVTIEYLREL